MSEPEEVNTDLEPGVPKPVFRRLPDERKALTHKFSIGNMTGYITVGMYEDGTPGEIFIVMAKEGSTISGLLDVMAASVSLNLQFGVPLRALVDRFTGIRFEPSGWTGNPSIPCAKSIVDYIFRWLGVRFCALTERVESPVRDSQQTLFDEAPLCTTCGAITQLFPDGSGWRCSNCGTASETK